MGTEYKRKIDLILVCIREIGDLELNKIYYTEYCSYYDDGEMIFYSDYYHLKNIKSSYHKENFRVANKYDLRKAKLNKIKINV